VLFEPDKFRILADGLDHPECVTADADGTLYAGGEAGQVYRIDDAGEVVEIGTTGGFTLGLCLDGDRNVYSCDAEIQAVMRMDPLGNVKPYSRGSAERHAVKPNYPVFDESGNLYFSDSGDWKQSNGCLFVVRPDGITEILRDDVASFPNGLAIDGSGDYLYVVESLANRVVRVPIDRSGHSTGAVEIIVELPDRHLPDGIAFDARGSLYVACYTPDVIYRVDADGVLQTVSEDWERVVLAAPTNVAFVGPDLGTFAVGSLGRRHVAGLDVGEVGARLRYPILPQEVAAT
jgi:gluconolactonase